MTAPSDRMVMKLRTPTDILEAVPYLLGFEPTDCLVALGLSGHPRRLGLTLRVDVTDVVGRSQVVAAVVTTLQSDDAECVVLIGYASTDATELDLLVGEVCAGLEGIRVTASECLRVVSGRWRSYLCTHLDCCPPEGKPVPDRVGEPGAIGPIAVLAGRQVLPDRNAMAATLSPVRGLLRDAMAAALDRELGRPPALPTRTLELVAACLEPLAATPDAGPGLELTVDDAARIIVGLLDVTARDACLDGWQHAADDATARLGRLVDARLRAGADRLWAELVRRAVAPGLAAPVATLLAWNRYVHHGGGALMTIALERALTDDPDYFMALALESLLDAAVPPERFADLIAGRDVPGRDVPGGNVPGRGASDRSARGGGAPGRRRPGRNLRRSA